MVALIHGKNIFVMILSKQKDPNNRFQSTKELKIYIKKLFKS